MPLQPALAVYVPDLAERWQRKDPRTYAFFLRPDVAFWDGSPLTSRDVRATYEAMLDLKLRSPKRELLSIIQAIHAPDPLTVVFHLHEPFAPFLEIALIQGACPKTPRKLGRLLGRRPFLPQPFCVR